MNIKEKLTEFFVTVSYIGKIKYAPGTFGSLAAFPLCWAIMYFTFYNQIIFSIDGFTLAEQAIITLIIIELLATFLLFLLGTYFSYLYIRNSKNQDPKEVVIDEIVGQMLVIIIGSLSIPMISNTELTKYLSIPKIDFIFLFLLPFILFRFFDIVKPWPINWLDKNIKGAFGIMLDDITAAIFAIVSYYVIVFLIL